MTDNGENETIDQNQFIDVLAQCAFEIPYRSPEPSSVEKIILFAEKMSQSLGSHKILKETGHTRLPNGESLDILNLFKQRYPEYFTKPIPKKVEFFDLLG
jgi:hypothetical protein